MRINTIIVDNFYNNAEDVRNFALQQEFTVKGNFPGKRTKSFLNDSTKERIQQILYPFGGNVTYWGDDMYTGSFQVTTAAERSWIHTDPFNSWAGVCYLTPDAPLSSGTAIYRRKKTNSTVIMDKENETVDNYEPNDMSKWDLVDRIGNVFNRLVLYRGDLWHSSLEYFGSNDIEGRLFQTFFITTEY